MQSLVLGPIGMTNSAYEQPLSADARSACGARAQRPRPAMDAKWHVYPELAAAGLWTTPTRSREVRDRDSADRARTIGAGAHAGERARDADAGRRRRLRGRLRDHEAGPGLVLRPRRLELGLPVRLIAHRVKGYGVAIMTNGDSGRPRDQRDRGAGRRRVRLGLARQAGSALTRGIHALARLHRATMYRFGSIVTETV